jgi:hypothetical protein
MPSLKHPNFIHKKIRKKMENKFQKVHARKDLLISGCILIAGIALFFLHKASGVCVIFCGILSLILYKSGYKLNGEGILLQKESLELQNRCRTSILDFLDGKTATPQLVPGNEGGTILLEVWFNAPADIAYARLSEYKALDFQTVTDIVELSADQAQSLIRMI